MMNKGANIVVTGAAGFIGSCLVKYLNEQGFENLLLVDDFNRVDKEPNLAGKVYKEKIDRQVFIETVDSLRYSIDYIFHLGARTDTTEFDYSIHEKWNLDYSKTLWNYCVQQKIPLIYASSAATYGSGELGYDDRHDLAESLEPLNPYGVSKNEFDKWILKQTSFPPFWAGLKFFNVYGPNESHKKRMASVIFHSYNQILANGEVKLFRSHRPDFKDGWQLRDFVYVKDVLKVCFWLMQNQPQSGIYNLGTGKARSFEDLVKATFRGLDKKPVIRFIDMPEDIRDKYQYFTEAKMDKLRAAGYTDEFYPLEEGVNDYVRNYLKENNYY